jgi:N-acetylmuramoyl-L-alanine amidase
MKILLICGHGAGDPGACAFDYQEATLVREAAPKLKNILSNYAEVTMFDPDKNMYKYLKAGNSFNFKEFDYVFELHFNAFNKKAMGTEILVHSLEKGTSVEELIVKNIAELGFKNRGVKRRTDLQNMNICKKVQGVSYALLETCFVDNFDDISLYNLKKDDIIKAIAEGIIEGFKLTQFKNDVQSSTNKVELLTSANDITWELNNSFFPIAEKEKFMKELDEAKQKNSSLYWGFYKLVNKIK